ncbi:MAG: alpha/beta hydrolase [Candidatus Limiplasma sp.]|nr:alpha/beta hydrolase [Candidatus Limiplasma sp.]
MAIKGLNPDWIHQEKGKNPVTKTDWIPRKTLDIPYGQQDGLQKVDIYLPSREAASYPVIVNVHGGGFTHCDKRDFHLYPTLYALERGYAVAAVNYRLSPGVRYPQHIQDVLLALEWIGREGPRHHLDPQNVFLWGTSAGGNIVLQIACKNGLLPRQDACNLRGVAALCPALDMVQLGGGSLMGFLVGLALKRPMLRHVLGSAKPSRDLLDQADVHRFLDGGIAPVYLQHGTKDPAIPYGAVEKFARKLQQILPERDFVFDTLSGAGHAGGGPDFFLRENVEPILDFFTAHCKEE